MTGITATIETITPETARQYLADKARNRSIKKGHVARLAADMQAGRWNMTGEAIKFNGHALIDGQHRLEACVISGCEFTTLVVRGVSHEAAKLMDIGVKRGVADVVGMFGDVEMPNTNTVAACARLVMSLRLRPDTPTAAYKTITHAEMVCEIEGSLDAYLAASRYGKSFRNWGSASSAAALMMVANAAGYSQQQLDDYHTRISTGAGLEPNHPCLTFRNWISARPSRSKVEPFVFLSAHIKCFGAFAHERPLQKLYVWRVNTPFPALEPACS